MLSEYFPSATIDEQIQNLLSKKLIINDIEYAKRTLSNISYYRLVKAYRSTLIDDRNNFKKNVTFEHLVKLYEFDNELRLTLMPILEKIEITLRCRIVNTFCNKYGALGYWNSENFRPDRFSRLKSKMSNNMDSVKDDSPIIRHFTSNKKVPLYAAAEVFTFGTLAQFFYSMKPEDQEEIAKLYYKGDKEYLMSWFMSVGNLRNKCVHFERLYNKGMEKIPKLLPEDTELTSNTKLFRVLSCMRYLCHEYEDDWFATVNAIKSLIEENVDYVNQEELGCFDGWYEKLLDEVNIVSKLLRQHQLQAKFNRT